MTIDPIAPSPSSASARSCPTRPTPATFWQQRARAAATRSPTSIRRAGTRPSTTTPNPQAPEKTYSKIGGWVRDWEWDPLGWKLPIPPQGRRRDGRRPEVGGRLHAHGAGRLRLARAPARPRAHRRDPRQRDVRRAALPDRAAHHLPRAGARARSGLGELRGAAGRRARRRSRASCTPTRGAGCRRSPRTRCPASSSNCIAGRVANLFNLHGPNFIVDAACASALAAIDASIDGLVAARVRRGDHRRRRPQHGRLDLREVLRDRRAVGHRHAALRRRRRRLRHGRGRRRCSCSSAWPTPSATATASTPWCAASAARATARARASPRPNPVGQRLAVERAWRNAGLSPGGVHAGRGPRHVDPRRRRRRGRRASPRRSPARDLAPGSVALGSVKSNIGHLKARRRRRRPPQGRAGAAPQGAAAEPQLRAPEPQHRLGRVPVRRQHRAARLGGAADGDRASPA